MDHVRWSERPSLRRPVLICAFEGWNDAGDASTTAARYLKDRWDGRPVADIDPEEFFDFSATRPQVRLDEGMQRAIDWPTNELFAATLPGSGADVLLLIGHEPQLRWRTFCRQVTEVAAGFEARLVVTLGALLADVAHSRPVSVIGTAYDPSVVARLRLRPSTYEGPTGIVGVLHAACRDAGIPSASLWAAVPTYVPAAPSPKAALALVERTAALLDVGVMTTDLEIASASYERQVSELVAADEDTADYVRRLEEHADEDDDAVPPLEDQDVDDLVEDIERFLRDRPDDR
jgi:proteasome assembly chaperone (PAC2) family protein